MAISARRLQRATYRSLVPGGGTSPTADAGSVPVGTASYAVPGDAIYVATTGNDTTGNGAVGSPYRTLARAVTAATTGKTIVLREGIYHEGNSNHTSATGIAVYKNNLTIQNYPNEPVWFDGSSVQTGWTQSGSTWYISWTKQFDHSPTSTSGANDGTDPGWKWINDNYPCAPFPEQVFIDGEPLTQVGSLGAVTAGTFFVDGTMAGNKIFTPTRLYIGTNPSGKTVNVTDLHNFLNLGQGYTNLTIRGIGIRRYGNALPQYAVLRFDGNNNTTNSLLENVVIEDTAGISATSNQCHGNTFRHVTVRRAGYRALGGYRSDNLTFDKVLIEYANTENFNSSPDSGCIKVTQSQHVTLSNSILRDSKCKGMWFDMSVYDMNVYNNDFLQLKDTCAFFEISGTGICANNLFVDCPSEAIKVNNTDNMQVWNNTIVNCGALSQRLTPDTSNLGNGDRRPLAVYQESRRPSNTSYGLDGRYPLGHAMYTSYMTWQINDIDIHNNIVADTPSNAYAIFCIDDQQVQSGGTNQLLASYGVNMTANVFHWTAAPTTTFPYPYIFPSTTVGSSTPVVYSTHAAMRSATSLNANGVEINAKGSGMSNASPIDANYAVTTAQAALHTSATALSGTIAALIGQSAGTKHAGAWRSETGTPPSEIREIGWIGDSLTYQDSGNGQTAIKNLLVAGGWQNTNSTRVDGLVGRSIINGVAPYIPSSQTVIDTWRADGFNPRTWCFALVTNDEWDTDSGWTTKVNTLLAKVKEVPHSSGLPYRIFWVGGPIYRQDIADANSPTYANRATRFAAVMASIRTAQLAGGQIGEMTYIDFPALYRNGRDETGHWQSGDSTGRHMTATGYGVRNAVTVPLVTPPGS